MLQKLNTPCPHIELFVFVLQLQLILISDNNWKWLSCEVLLGVLFKLAGTVSGFPSEAVMCSHGILIGLRAYVSAK